MSVTKDRLFCLTFSINPRLLLDGRMLCVVMTMSTRILTLLQLKCIGGSAGCSSFSPQVVQCYNRGSDGFDVQVRTCQIVIEIMNEKTNVRLGCKS